MIHDPSIGLLEGVRDPSVLNEHEMEVSGGMALMPHGDLPEGDETSSASGKQTKPKKTGIAIYTVKEGDSLSEIAEEHGVSTKTILWANDIRDASTIRIGDDLIILPVSGVQHKVASGETLQAIAKKYGSDVSDIALYNGISESKGLAAGSEIIVPGGAFPSTPPKSIGSTGSSKKSTASTKSSSSSSSSGKFGNPLPGRPISQANHGYNAVDIDGETGDPIYASAGGSVIIAKGGGGYNGGYGNYIVIDNGGGVQTLYAHMSSLEVSGGTVGKGEVIGYVGNTGKSTGSHLHFEVRGATNPL
ncbi:MAG: putative membrane bound lytic murein transglycosylase B [Parcubacteria bacterium C7867-008]|nr:MAG: putative membrane bound lytic murein transglycosylase B [Parcubacteria bacterium C7867-008]